MRIASVGILSDSAQIPNNYNTGLIHDLVLLLVLLLVRSLLLFLEILHEILPIAGTTAEASIAEGDSTIVEHTEKLEHIVAVVAVSPFGYTVVVAQTVNVAQTMAAVVMV